MGRNAGYTPAPDSPGIRYRLACQLSWLQETLQLNAEETARLLANPGEHYPTGALVRLMRSQSQAPSARFMALVNARVSEVECQLTAGVSALVIAGRVKTVWHVTPKQHITPLVSGAELGECQPGEALARLVGASLSVAPNKVATCRVCGGLMIRSSTRQTVCRRRDATGAYVCVLAARREAAQNRRQNGAYKSVYSPILAPGV